MQAKKKENAFSIPLIILFLIALLSAPFIVLYVLNNGNPYERYLVNKHVPKHLEDLGYEEEDFVQQNFVTPNYTINKSVYQGHYLVIFKDEPELKYLYGVTKWGKKVVQFCEKETFTIEEVTEKTKHSEDKCIGYLDNRW